MSLKTFHIVFVTVSVLLMLVIAAWNFGNYRDNGTSSDLTWGVVSVVAAVGLLRHDHEPRATDYVPQMLGLIAALERGGQRRGPFGPAMNVGPDGPGKHRFALALRLDRLAIDDGEHLRLRRQLGKRTKLRLRLVPFPGNRQQLEQEHAVGHVSGVAPDDLDQGTSCPVEIARTQTIVRFVHIALQRTIGRA